MHEDASRALVVTLIEHLPWAWTFLSERSVGLVDAGYAFEVPISGKAHLKSHLCSLQNNAVRALVHRHISRDRCCFRAAFMLLAR